MDWPAGAYGMDEFDVAVNLTHGRRGSVMRGEGTFGTTGSIVPTATG